MMEENTCLPCPICAAEKEGKTEPCEIPVEQHSEFHGHQVRKDSSAFLHVWLDADTGLIGLLDVGGGASFMLERMLGISRVKYTFRPWSPREKKSYWYEVPEVTQ